MYFEITASQQTVRKPLTPTQRRSSLFSEAPRIGATTLRRGQVMRLDQDQFKAQESVIKRLFDAGAVEISMVDGDKREDFRQKEQDWKASKAPVAKKASPPPSAPPPPPSAPRAPPPDIELAPVPEPEPEAAKPAAPVAVVSEEAPAMDDTPVVTSQPESGKGKKGRK